MKSNVEVKWIDNTEFEADLDGHKITMDIEKENGGNNKGPKPKPLMMAALAGCTGIDVVSILKKMKVKFVYFNLVIEAEMTESHPKVYEKMHVIYEFKGNELNLEKIQKAVDLSREKYCGVSFMYKKAFELTYEIKILA